MLIACHLQYDSFVVLWEDWLVVLAILLALHTSLCAGVSSIEGCKYWVWELFMSGVDFVQLNQEDRCGNSSRQEVFKEIQ